MTISESDNATRLADPYRSANPPSLSNDSACSENALKQPPGHPEVNVVRCPMERAKELRQRAERYRLLEKDISDTKALQAISDVAGELEATAEELERQQQVSERAREIWIEHRRPEGRDVEFWLAAERELDGQQRRRRA
jgi:Protein of unknown function (DUF2934)